MEKGKERSCRVGASGNLFLGDRILTVALLLLCSVCLSVCPSMTLCIVAKRCVLEQKLLLRA